jgi:hypothetical protein
VAMRNSNIIYKTGLVCRNPHCRYCS